MKTAVIILAAGSSSRLGQAKQNLHYKGKTLLQHSIDTALSAGCSPVMVVVGASSEEILTGLETTDITILQNKNWATGMASSIHAGIDKLSNDFKKVKQVILMVCDQPFVDPILLNKLIEEKTKGNKKIVASAYSETLGVPALFDKSIFPELLSLKGSEGAKKILLTYSKDVAKVPFPLGHVDIDTMEDYNDLATN